VPPGRRLKRREAMGDAAENRLGTLVEGDSSNRWTPDNPEFREFLAHIAEIIANGYIETIELTEDRERVDVWTAAIQGKSGVPEALTEEVQPGSQEACGDGIQPTTTTVQVADKRKGGSDGKEA